MTLEEAEIPDRRLGKESLGPVTKVNRWLYLAVILLLGTVLIIGVAGWLLLAADDKSIPDGLSVLLGTVAGALIALITADAKK